jgi:hypothetical protein
MGFIQDLPYKIRDEIFRFPTTFNTLFTINSARNYKSQQFANIEPDILEETKFNPNNFVTFSGPQLKEAGKLRSLRSEPALPKLCTDYQKSAPTLFRQKTRVMKDRAPDLIIQLEDIEDDFLNMMRNPPPPFNSQLTTY